MSQTYSEVEIKPGNIIRVYSEEDTKKFEKKWMATFCKNKQGLNTKAFKWHTFSSETYPAESGEKAQKEYEKQTSPEYIILSNDSELAVETDMLPTECNLSDYYISPKNLAWTMAFTHEDGWLGPYFATHQDYNKLNAENKENLNKLLIKQKQIEIAKRNGWV